MKRLSAGERHDGFEVRVRLLQRKGWLEMGGGGGGGEGG